jgi:hypothetical protein
MSASACWRKLTSHLLGGTQVECLRGGQTLAFEPTRRYRNPRDQVERCYFLNRWKTMSSRAESRSRLSLIIHATLVALGLSTYLIDRDDVVWHFIKSAPHRRVLEHAFFGLAAVLLGISLVLKVRSSAPRKNQSGQNHSRTRALVASFLQAIGIGSLLPLPGFLLLALADPVSNLLLDGRLPIAKEPESERNPPRIRNPLHGFRGGRALAPHIGLCLALLSMTVFSVVLIDRVADILFAATALISIAASLRPSMCGHG